MSEVPTSSGKKSGVRLDVGGVDLTYREHQKKIGLVWHDDGTISYYRRKFWYFEPEMSVGPLTDNIVTLNLPMVTAANYAQGSFMMEYGLSDMLQTVEVSWLWLCLTTNY